MKKIVSILVLLVAALGLSGCNVGGGNLRHANEVSIVKRGVVTGLQPVTLAGTATGIGAASGAAVGTAIGANIGGDWKTRLVGALVGQVAGAVAGNAVEKKVTETNGVEVTIKLDDGNEVAIPKRNEEVAGITIGSRVRITTRGSAAAIERVE